MNKLNIGIIGAGRIGKIHAQNLIAHPGVKVKAISDLQIHSVSEWAKDWAFPELLRIITKFYWMTRLTPYSFARPQTRISN